jgi:hypothetical protein
MTIRTHCALGAPDAEMMSACGSHPRNNYRRPKHLPMSLGREASAIRSRQLLQLRAIDAVEEGSGFGLQYPANFCNEIAFHHATSSPLARCGPDGYRRNNREGVRGGLSSRGLAPGLYNSIWDSTQGIGNDTKSVTPAQLDYVKQQNEDGDFRSRRRTLCSPRGARSQRCGCGCHRRDGGRQALSAGPRARAIPVKALRGSHPAGAIVSSP